MDGIFICLALLSKSRYNHAALGLWRLSHWLCAAAAEPIGLGQTKGCFYNRVFPEPLSVCGVPANWHPAGGTPDEGSPGPKQSTGLISGSLSCVSLCIIRSGPSRPAPGRFRDCDRGQRLLASGLPQAF